MSKQYHIALLPGDGVGQDVMDAARQILAALELPATYTHGDIGWEFWKKEGNPLPDRTLSLLEKTDCALFGAITSKPKDEALQELAPELQNKGLNYISPIVTLRQRYDLYMNVRPCSAFPGNPLQMGEDIDLVVFRENTEGLYSGVEFSPLPGEVRKALRCHAPNMQRFDEVPAEDIAVSCRVFTRKSCERIVRAAFSYAKEHDYPSVTLVEKPNVVRATSGLMVEVAREVARDYPDIELWETNIDAMCMWLVKKPHEYGVIVASNMFGDILSDLCAQLVGGLGFAASGNIGDTYAVFEPTHGSAPKYTGQDKVNPLAMILSVKMMLSWLGEGERADRLNAAIAHVISEGTVRTYDMGGSHTTSQMATAVTQAISTSI